TQGLTCILSCKEVASSLPLGFHLMLLGLTCLLSCTEVMYFLLDTVTDLALELYRDDAFFAFGFSSHASRTDPPLHMYLGDAFYTFDFSSHASGTAMALLVVKK
ncbi:hypothetical protein SK128_028332, partial [Halocaridina rubra]